MKAFRLLLVAAMLICAMGTSALAKDITVINGTGFTIQQLGLADSEASGDAEDLLGDGTLAPNEGLVISISGDSKGWELIAVDGEGTQVNWQNLDLTSISQITLHADGSASVQ